MSRQVAEMDDAIWAETTRELSEAAEMMTILSRCLSVDPQLQEWKRTADEVAGGDAANALDQARGMLERLTDGGAAALLEHIDALLSELPPARE